MKNKYLYSGQAILVVLLIMVIALTVGVSVSLRSIKNIKISTRTEESQRAFSAAEAGLEAVLSDSGGGTVTGDLSSVTNQTVSYSATKDYYGDGQEFVFPQKTGRDDTQQVWLISHEEGNTGLPTENCTAADQFKRCYLGNSLTLCWGNGSENPALEATLIFKEGIEYKIKKFAIDPLTTRANNFETADDNNSGSGLQADCSVGLYRKVISFPAGVLNIAVRLRLLYNTTEQELAVKSIDPTFNLPYQGLVYRSSGSTKVSGTNETAQVRTLEFKKSYPYLPGLFDFALFSGTAITK